MEYINIGAIVLGIIVGAGLALLFVAYIFSKQMSKLDEQIIEAIEEIRSKFIILVVEKENGRYFGYRKEDHQFICQGNDIQDFLEAFKKAQPNKTAVIANTTDISIIEEFKEISEKNENIISI